VTKTPVLMDSAMILAWGVCFVSAMLGTLPVSADMFPLEGRPVVTSSFGEYRPGRLHMGMDFSTGGRTRLPVRAIADGTVVRARCSPWGYGKAVYTRLDSGQTVVYAHLSDFREDIRRAIRSAQHARKSYTVDLTFKPGEYPVKKGEIIAWSGDTGVGPAHLHVEFRDEAERPIEPRRAGLPWPAEHTCPTVFGVAIYPADPESQVNGSPFPCAVGVDRIAPGRYRISPLSVTGRVYFGAAVQDLTPEGNRLGVWRAAVRVGDRTVYEVRFDRLSYEHQETGVLCFDPYSRIEGVPVLQVWRRPGNTLEAYGARGSDGSVEIGGAPESVALEFEDLGGNVSVVEIPLRPEIRSAVPSKWPVAEGIVSMYRGVGVFTRRRGADNVEALFRAVDGSGEVRMPLGNLEEGLGGWWLPPRPGTWAFSFASNGVAQPRIMLAVGDSRQETRLESESARFIVPAGALPPDTCVWMEESGKPEVSGLEVLSAGARLQPEGAPVLKPFTVELPLPAGASMYPVAICRVTGAMATWLTTRQKGNWLEAESSAAGCFVVAGDQSAPTASAWHARPDPGQPNRPEIRVTVSDRGSGIATWDLYCGEQWLLSAYDPDTGVVTWERDEDLPGPVESVQLVLQDKAGNRSTWPYRSESASGGTRKGTTRKGKGPRTHE